MGMENYPEVFYEDKNLKQNIEPSFEEYLKVESKKSRSNAGPIKDKKHPTWAWVSGYLDGDGHYSKRYDKNPQKTTLMRITKRQWSQF